MSSILLSSLLLLAGLGAAALAYRRYRARPRAVGWSAALAALALFAGAAWVGLHAPSPAPSGKVNGEVSGPGAPATAPAASAAPPAAANASGGNRLPSNRQLMIQHLGQLQQELEQARKDAHSEHRRSEALSRRLGDLEAQVKALLERIKRQGRRAHELRERLQRESPPAARNASR